MPNGSINTKVFVTVIGSFSSGSNTFSGSYQIQFTGLNTDGRNLCLAMLKEYVATSTSGITINVDGFWSNTGEPYTPYVLIDAKNSSLPLLSCDLEK
ncbi:MAG: hypothetical protein IPK04_01925 [Bdellovibrionales bacterium]|nr:hypothetical protein [Bdellovibrionales bacterium]